jgi:hypothetical protein
MGEISGLIIVSGINDDVSILFYLERARPHSYGRKDDQARFSIIVILKKYSENAITDCKNNRTECYVLMNRFIKPPTISIYNKDMTMTETLPQDDMDDATINEIVAFINERIVAHVYHGFLEVGKTILEKFFNNDISLAGLRNPHKPVSYRKLCNHPDLPVSRASLMNMVKTGAQSGFLTAHGIAEDKIKYSHLILLTRLENSQEKLDLAQACIDEQLIYGELKQRIQEICRQAAIPPSTAVLVEKHLTRIERWIRGVSAPEGMTNETVIDGMSPSEKEKILDAAGGILEDMSVITNKIRQLVMILTKPPVVPEIEEPDSTPDSSDA